MGDLQRIHPDEGKPHKRATAREASPWATQVTKQPAKTPDEPPVLRESAIEAAAFAANEVYAGYLDGLDSNIPEPSDNRSASYRHGFANARDDLVQHPRATTGRLRQLAAEAAEQDAKA